MDRSSLAPGAHSTRLSWRPPEGQEGKRKDPLRLELSPHFSEMTSATCGLPQAFGTCLRSGAGASVLGEVVNSGHPGSRSTCSAQFSMEPRTHPATGSPASHPLFFAAPLSFKCVKLKWKADRCFVYFGG